jgi:hypothetical protein
MICAANFSDIAVQLSTEHYLGNNAIQLAMVTNGVDISLAECKSPKYFLLMYFFLE